MLGTDLNSSRWCDMVFEGKDHAYGGYVLRRNLGLRQLVAFIIVAALLLCGVYLPQFHKRPISQAPRQQLVYEESVVHITAIDEMELELPTDELRYIEMPPPPPLRSSLKFTAPVITADEESDEEVIKTQEELQDAPIAISIADIIGEDVEDAQDIADFRELVADPDVVYDSPEQQRGIDQLPQFPGGEVALMQYIGENVKYPAGAAEQKIHGKVVLRFAITESGDVGDIHVLHSPDEQLRAEVERALRDMPRWIPGKKNGEPVTMWFAMPIHFVLRTKASQ